MLVVLVVLVVVVMVLIVLLVVLLLVMVLARERAVVWLLELLLVATLAMLQKLSPSYRYIGPLMPLQEVED